MESVFLRPIPRFNRRSYRAQSPGIGTKRRRDGTLNNPILPTTGPTGKYRFMVNRPRSDMGET